MLRALLAGPLQPVDLPLHRLPHGGGHGHLGDPGPVLGGDVAVGLAQLLADGVHLLAEHELALALLHALAHVGADPLLELQLAEGVAGPGQRLGQPLLDIDGFQQLDALLEGQVGGVAGAVGQRPGIADTPEGLGQRPGVAVLEDGLDHGPVLPHEFPGAIRRSPGRVLHRLGLDEQSVARRPLAEAGDGGAEDRPVQAAHQHGPSAAGKAAGLFDLGHRADLGVDRRARLGLDPGDEHQQALAGQGGVGRRLGVVALEAEGHDHLRQHHSRGQREQGQEPGLHVRH